MTDNEGESGYAYRNVVRALGAMGLDFVFATDHASNSVQIDGAGEARDLTSLRYIAAKEIMNGPRRCERRNSQRCTNWSDRQLHESKALASSVYGRGSRCDA